MIRAMHLNNSLLRITNMIIETKNIIKPNSTPLDTGTVNKEK